MRMTLETKVKQAKEKGIILPQELLNDDIVGIYGLFATKENKKKCFYIGKATNICSRLLDSSYGHIHSYLKGREGFVQNKIKKYIDNGYMIEVEILKEIDYKDTCFSKAAHRLALAELEKIVEFQEKGECLDQLPEGTTAYQKRYWENKYKIRSQKEESC